MKPCWRAMGLTDQCAALADSVLPEVQALVDRVGAEVVSIALAEARFRRHDLPLRVSSREKGGAERPIPPVDRSARCTVGEAIAPGVANTEDRGDGQQKGYVILCDEERRKGFVRPVRFSYIHEKCGSKTTMGLALSETYARAPKFYSGTFCCQCGAHFPVGADGEFRWEDGSKVGT